jgi:hypothetical protein
MVAAKFIMWAIGSLDAIIGLWLIVSNSEMLLTVVRSKQMDPFVIFPLLGCPLFVILGFIFIWGGIVSVRFKNKSRVFNLFLYSAMAYLSVPIGLFFAVFGRNEPLLKRVLCLFPGLIALLIILFLTRPHVKEQFSH